MKKIGQNILTMLTVLVVTLSFVQITYAASSSYSFTMNYRLADVNKTIKIPEVQNELYTE